MPGVYIHIPFCKQACHYCNFHFSTSLRYKNELIDALLQEIELRRNYLEDKHIDTIYFGGGTPSLLSSDEINRILDRLAAFYDIDDRVEVTLEANPDDLDQQKILDLSKTAVNRLSIGIQSFHEVDLKFMNRAHSVVQAEKSILMAQDQGFYNLSVDLIYGAPTTTETMWLDNLGKTASFNVPHLSAYCLTVEPDTALHHFVKAGKVADVSDDKSARQFQLLTDAMAVHNYNHYEISNFARSGFVSRHNSSYWQRIPYIGLGPSAHSFDRLSREWNVSHNAQYIKAIQEGESATKKEYLSVEQQFNEYLMTSLRTIWGCDLSMVHQDFGETKVRHLLKKTEHFIKAELMINKEATLVLTPKGKFLADGIISELMIV